jgi:hypothetical protein
MRVISPSTFLISKRLLTDGSVLGSIYDDDRVKNALSLEDE